MKVIDKNTLNNMEKPKILEYIMKQLESIDKRRGYSSGVSKYELINYPKEVLIKIALTNNEYIIEFGDKECMK